MPTSGFQPWLSRRSRTSKDSSTVKWLKPVSPRSYTSSTWFGETSWGRKMQLSRESSPFKCRTCVASSWPRKPLMKTCLKGRSQGSRRNSLSLTCNFTTTRGVNSIRRRLDHRVAAVMAKSRLIKLCKTRRRPWRVKMKTCARGLASLRLTKILPTRIAARKEQHSWMATWTKWETKVIFLLKLCE